MRKRGLASFLRDELAAPQALPPNDQIAGVSDVQTSVQSESVTPKPPQIQETGATHLRAVRLREPVTPEVPDSEVSGIPDLQTSAPPEFVVMEVPNLQITGIANLQASALPESEALESSTQKTAKVTDLQTAVPSESVTTDVPSTQTTDVTVLQVSVLSKSAAAEVRSVNRTATGVADEQSLVQPESVLPRYLRLTRKEVRFRDEQLAALDSLTRRLVRARRGLSRGEAERLTENTLVRVAVDLLLHHSETLAGATEEELLHSVLPNRKPTSV